GPGRGRVVRRGRGARQLCRRCCRDETRHGHGLGGGVDGCGSEQRPLSTGMSDVGRILSEAELGEEGARERAEGRTVAFANGCFDLLHVGHVRYLLGAAAEGDRLVVAVNDDESVARLKGPGRPILRAADRAELVAALKGVSYVVVFGDETVAR